MTTYTADDFEHARFATHPDGRVAARIGRDLPWVMPCIENCESVGLECNGLDHAPASFMANEGWTPVREQPRPLTLDAIESVLHDILPLSTEHLDSDDIADIASDLYLALTEPTRPTELQVLAKVSAYMDEAGGEGIDAVTDFLAERGVRVVTEGEN